MASSQKIKQEFIQDYGEAYHSFGLPVLMGRIVGLLLFVDSPISLTDIASELGMSKGPVSQIMRRLKDHNLITRIWVHGDRKDYYQADPNIFSNAFQNYVSQIKGNLDLSKKYIQLMKDNDLENSTNFKKRIDKMNKFYELMIKHHHQFLEEWENSKNS